MPNPAKPIELKEKLGNPGRKRLPEQGELLPLSGGRVEPSRPLGDAGMQLWDSVFSHGELWISNTTDIHLLLLVCEQYDRRETLRQALLNDPTNNTVLMRLGELEKLITGNLSLLGFTPADRSKLGFRIARTQSKLDMLAEKLNG
jgi:hypothetical protein